MRLYLQQIGCATKIYNMKKDIFQAIADPTRRAIISEGVGQQKWRQGEVVGNLLSPVSYDAYELCGAFVHGGPFPLGRDATLAER